MSDLMHHYETSAFVEVPAQQLFAELDDHERLSSHMSQSSWMLGGGRMRIEFDDGRGKRIGSRIRLSGKAAGLELSVEEIVTERNPPLRKCWETVGTPKLWVIGHYRMGFEITSQDNGSLLRVYIDYDLPETAPSRWLGYLLGRYYARWCTQRMVKDAAKRFATLTTQQLNMNSPSPTNKAKQAVYWLVALAGCLAPAPVLGQEQFYERGWGMHPMMWGAWGLGMMFMMILFWTLLVVGIVLLVRWLLAQARETRTDSALEILRQRYARGEINKEEFEAKKKDLTT
jgi:uncharacterized membrane protein